MLPFFIVILAGESSTPTPTRFSEILNSEYEYEYEYEQPATSNQLLFQ